MRRVATILIISTLIAISTGFDNAAGDPKKIPVKRDTLRIDKTNPSNTYRRPRPAIAEEDRNIYISGTITKFVVKKSAQKMYVYFGDTFKVFKISLGASPVGDKLKRGDKKTPEGTYKICFKNPNSRGYKSLKISYPDENDKKESGENGVDPGGDIFIHGLWWTTQDPKTHWKDNWTDGCIAVNNEQIDEIYSHTDLETDIIIMP